MRSYYIGVDIGGTTVKMGLYREPDEWVEKWEIPTRRENSGTYILPDVSEAIIQAYARHGIKKEDVVGIGVGVPGPVLRDGTVRGCVNLGWDTFNVSTMLGDLTGLPVFVANDANIAALGEQWKGAGSEYESVALLTLGTGVGGGIILDGHIVGGALGAAGEIGHLPVLPDGTAQCNCGKTNCLELAGSATGLLRYAKQRLAQDDTPSAMRDVDALTTKDICDCCADGDALATECVLYAADALGTAAACIGCMFDPDVILFGGGMAAAGDILLDPIREVYRKKVFPPIQETPILRATLGNDAGVTGGVRLVQIMM